MNVQATEPKKMTHDAFEALHPECKATPRGRPLMIDYTADGRPFWRPVTIVSRDEVLKDVAV